METTKDRLLRLWENGKATELHINNAVTKGLITQDEANEILAAPQIGTI